MKPIESRIFLLISAISYFLAGIIFNPKHPIGSFFALIGIITLLIGILRFVKEKKEEKKSKQN